MDFSQKQLEAEAVKEKAAITEDTLRQLLSQFQIHVPDRNIPEIKTFIVEKVIIYKAHVDVIFKLQIVDLPMETNRGCAKPQFAGVL